MSVTNGLHTQKISHGLTPISTDGFESIPTSWNNGLFIIALMSSY